MVIPPRLVAGTEPQAPVSANDNKTRGTYGGEVANFDTNMVIILAALLCALLFALGLNSIMRCVMRCSRRMAFESSDGATVRLACTGLKKRALHEIPVTVYGPESDIRSAATDCPICLGEFMEGEKVRVLPKCNHGFHVKCIDRWLVAHSSCPTCRHSLLDRTVVDSADVESGTRTRTTVSGSGGSDGPVVVVAVG
ncbi:RING-H2 finger protein ATL74-like [Magnolia sinica]|uniref:RING-H2 finger protein ATL74-like n=1 Tax=Magnolia sinica TaxID=86752 RepID=UPI002659C3BB|nr:RING-H2 finger protein ATL74-like [Magnolia sinica]XP_058110629.1 RING-H2 finger protein ATL74-like [Magnolia sinica]